MASLASAPSFLGYRPPDGSVGVRNVVHVVGINGLVARATERIARSVPATILVATSL